MNPKSEAEFGRASARRPEAACPSVKPLRGPARRSAPGVRVGARRCRASRPHSPCLDSGARPLRGPAGQSTPGVRPVARHAAQADRAQPWRARRGHWPPVRCLELSGGAFVQKQHLSLAERGRDLEAAARCVGRGPAPASRAWVSGDCSRGTAAQSLRTPGVRRRAGGALRSNACWPSRGVTHGRRNAASEEGGFAEKRSREREVHDRWKSMDSRLRGIDQPFGKRQVPRVSAASASA
mgnify:CR=1 FL=1